MSAPSDWCEAGMKVEYAGPDLKMVQSALYGYVESVHEDLTATVQWHCYRGEFTNRLPIHFLRPFV